MIALSLSILPDEAPEISDIGRPNCASDAHFLALTGSFAPTKKKSQCFARSCCVLSREQARSSSISGRSDDPGLDFAASDTHFLALTGLFAPTFASHALLDSPSLPRSTPLRPIYKPHLVNNKERFLFDQIVSSL